MSENKLDAMWKELRRRIAAKLAVMRQALEYVREYDHHARHSERVEAALAPDAGSALLDELRLLREVARDARETVRADDARIKHGRAPAAECRLGRSLDTLDDFDKVKR